MMNNALPADFKAKVEEMLGKDHVEQRTVNNYADVCAVIAGLIMARDNHARAAKKNYDTLAQLHHDIAAAGRLRHLQNRLADPDRYSPDAFCPDAEDR